MENKLRRKISRGIKVMKGMSALSQRQPYIVLGVAGAYIGASFMCKVFCKDSDAISLDYSKCHIISSPFCENPHEISIPLTYVASNTSSTLSVATIFADSENLSFQV